MRARRFPSLVVAMMLGAALTTVPSGRRDAGAQTPAPDAAEEVAFVTFRDGDFEIYAMAPDGSDQRNVSQAPTTSDLDPAWSPDGTRIAFSRFLRGNPTSEIYVMNADGTGKVRLTADHGAANDREPSWNPPGTVLAFTRTVPAMGTSRIYVMRADGSGRRPLTLTPPRRYDANPAWSPVGGRIAFVSNRSGGFPEIWVMNTDGSLPMRLTYNSFVDANPVWSPDGSRIAFERCCIDGSSDIYVMNADGTSKVRLTTSPANEAEPTWAPDGSSIAFVVFPLEGGNRDLHSVNLDGTGERVLTVSSAADLRPDWYGPRPVPVPEPTPSPTAEPTPSPTAEPTPSPTPEPTPSPTAEPTPSPTAEPTPSPTAEPTPSPTSPGSGAAVRAIQASAIRVLATRRPRYRTLETRRVLPGLSYRKILDRKGPNRVYVLRMNPLLRPTLDVALAGGVLPGLARTSRIAAAHQAVAAVNGDFGLPDGRPVHPFAEDGSLHQTSFAYSHNVAVTHDEDPPAFLHPTARLSALQTGSGDVLRVDRWNQGQPTWGEIGAYTHSGGSLERAPTFACSARLQPTGPRRWAEGELGVSRDYRVNDSACRQARMVKQGGLVVSAQSGSPEALLIRSLVRGEILTLTWSFGWASVPDSVGGYPLLMADGKIVVTGCGASFCYRHPRTAIGVDAAGRVLLVVVDGRRKASVGMTLLQLAKLLENLGAVAALNLDGGGSTTMVVRGRIVNKPSSGWERYVSSAVMILDGADPGERIEGASPLTATEQPAPPSSLEAQAMNRRLGRLDSAEPRFLDPASTGGMLDAMDRGLFVDRRVPYPPSLRLLLRAFRSSI